MPTTRRGRRARARAACACALVRDRVNRLRRLDGHGSDREQRAGASAPARQLPLVRPQYLVQRRLPHHQHGAVLWVRQEQVAVEAAYIIASSAAERVIAEARSRIHERVRKDRAQARLGLEDLTDGALRASLAEGLVYIYPNPYIPSLHNTHLSRKDVAILASRQRPSSGPPPRRWALWRHFVGPRPPLTGLPPPLPACLAQLRMRHQAAWAGTM